MLEAINEFNVNRGHQPVNLSNANLGLSESMVIIGPQEEVDQQMQQQDLQIESRQQLASSIVLSEEDHQLLGQSHDQYS